MIKSMTGFGRGEAFAHGTQMLVELKGVNHRFVETVVRLPRPLNSLEDRVRKYIQARIQRGRIEVYINMVEGQARKSMVKLDKDIALSYDKTLRELALSLNSVYETDIYRLVGLPEVLSIEEGELDLEQLWETCAHALEQALTGFLHMRQTEGQKLWEDLQERLNFLDSELEKISLRADTVVTDYQNRLQERIRGLLGEVQVDEARLANEVAVFADRASITEELVRFRSHLSQIRQSFSSDESVGRKLDFLVQEMNREINTIGSKANDLTISQTVVAVKSELEKVREQIQNIE